MNAPEKKKLAPITALTPPAAKTKIAAAPVKKAVNSVVSKAAETLSKPAVKEAVTKAALQPNTENGKISKIAGSLSARTPATSPVLAPVRMASAPLKPGRRSSARTAVLTPPPAPMVPTHAPDAAKASYSLMVERVIAPPIQVAAPKDSKLANNWKSKAADQLSDEEVKAMADADYMNEAQLAFFATGFQYLSKIFTRVRVKPLSTCVKMLPWYPIRLTAPLLKRSMHWNCVRVTGNASFLRRLNNRLPALIQAITAIATKQANPLA